jgi:ribonuclease HI
MKFYAVRQGRVPGIYTSWSECQKQVKGYSNATYKSFKTHAEAKRFLDPSLPKKEVCVDTPTSLSIYVDGSHIKGTSRLGYGILCLYQGQGYILSRNPVLREDIENLVGSTIDVNRFSNPTMEFLAVADVLHRIALDTTDRFQSIHIHYDYIGSERWLTGKWKSRQAHIQAVHRFAKTSLETLLSKGIKVEWVHTPAHTGVWGNEMADCLAKGEAIPETMPQGKAYKSLNALFHT